MGFSGVYCIRVCSSNIDERTIDLAPLHLPYGGRASRTPYLSVRLGTNTCDFGRKA